MTLRTRASNARDYVRRNSANIALALFSLLIAIAICEYLAQRFTHFPIHSPISNRVTDDRLLFRTSPNVREVDRNGFRNPPDHDVPFPRIAAIGDSQTYGYNVPRDASWPARLEKRIGEKVYNLGVGNYGYINLVASAERALEFGARHLLIATHPINDLEICRTVRLPYWIDRLSAEVPAGPKILERCRASADDPPLTAYEILNRSRKRGWYRRLKDQSALWSMLRYFKNAVLGLRDSFGGIRLAECNSDDKDFVYQAGAMKDLVPYLNFGSNPPVRPIDEMIIRYAFGEIAKMAAARSANVQVLVIPSRPMTIAAYLRMADRDSEAPDWFRKSVGYEGTQIGFVRKVAQELGLPVADATEETAKAYKRVTDAGKTFFPCSDSHPLAEGYDAYAKVAKTLLGG